jgi:hypothetical protein
MLHTSLLHKSTCKKLASWWKESVCAVPASCQGPRTLAQYPVWLKLQGQRSLLQGVTQLPQNWLIPHGLDYQDTSLGLHVHKRMPVVHPGMPGNHWKRFKSTLTNHTPVRVWQSNSQYHTTVDINPLLPNDPYMCHPLNMAKDRTTSIVVANSVPNLKAFFHPLSQVLLTIYTRYVRWMLGLLCGVRITPPPPLKPLQKPVLGVNTFQLRIFLRWLIPFQILHGFVYFFELESSVAWITTVGYDTSTNSRAEMFSVAYCNAYFSDQIITQNLEISAKIHVYSYRGLTDMSLVVLGHSLGVVGQ